MGNTLPTTTLTYYIPFPASTYWLMLNFMAGQSKIPDFDPQGPQLVYVAVADHIAARIAAGELQPGARLPAERDLATEYRVAYLTVRRAARELRQRGLIVTVHGKGTFVADPLPKQAGSEGE